MAITQRDLAETIVGLKQAAQSLTAAASTQPVPDMGEPVVIVKVAGLIAVAEYLETVAAELLTLVEERPVEVKPNSDS